MQAIIILQPGPPGVYKWLNGQKTGPMFSSERKITLHPQARRRIYRGWRSQALKKLM